MVERLAFLAVDLFEYAQKSEPKPEAASPDEPIFTVGEITSEIKGVLEGNFGRERIWVKGELSNFRGKNQTGHIYFNIKDDQAVLNCAFFRNANRNLKFELKEGLEVLVGGRISVYPPRGSYQLIVEKILPGGTGELYLRFEQLKKKLEAEGLFAQERKRELPDFPQRIGLVTSATGAVVRDIIHVVRHRCPYVTLLLCPVKVQGEGAAEEIAHAITHLNHPRHKLDLLMVGRGGGSIEDLWAFNEEGVARAIASSSIPVVSAVGHQTDFTIADFVADVRAATPSQAAELTVPNMLETHRRVDILMRNIVNELGHAREKAVRKLEGLMRSPVLRDPRLLIRNRGERIERAVERMAERVSGRRVRWVDRFGNLRHRFRTLLAKTISPRRLEFERVVSNLGLLDPLAILARGYSVVNKEDGSIVKESRQVKKDEEVQVRLHEGKLWCQVKKILPK